MLTFLTGTNICKKREEIERRILSLVDSGKRAVLIVPQQSASDRDRDFLLKYGEHDSDILAIEGLERFVAQMLEDKGLSTKPYVEKAARNVLMSLAVESLLESLDVYKRHASRKNNIDILLSAYDELKQAGATSEMLRTTGTGSTGRKVKELSLIFAAFEALVNERFSDSSDNIKKLLDFLKTNRCFEDCVFFFDDFRGLTHEQTRLVSAIAKDAKDVYFSVCADSLTDDGNEAFVHSRRNAEAIRKCATADGVRVFEEKISSDTLNETAIDFLRDTMFSQEDISFDGNGDDITVYTASDVYDECSFVAANIKKLIESGKYRCRDIGVYERSGNYTKKLAVELKNCGIPVSEDERRPLSEYPLVRMILFAGEIAAYGFNTQRVLSYIKTGITGIDDDECDTLENYVTMWSIDGKAWESEFTANPDGYGISFVEEQKEKLNAINDIRKRAVEPLSAMRAALSNGDARSCCTAVYSLITSTGAKGEYLKLAVALNEHGAEKEALCCIRVWDEVINALDVLYKAIGENTVTKTRFYEMLSLILSEDSLGDIPSGLDRIIIGTADRTRFLSPKVIFVMGLTQGDFPMSTDRQSLFTAKEKRELIAAGIPLESIPENIYFEERLIAYNAVVSAKEKVYLTSPLVSTSGEKKEKSEVINEVLRRIPNAKQIEFNEIKREDKIYSPSSGLDAYALNIDENSEFTCSVYEALKHFPNFAGRIEAVKFLHRGMPDEFSDKAIAKKLFGEKLYISPSRLETYSKCPFMYYCRYGMKAQNTEPASFDARINGLLVHKVFEELLGTYTKEELTHLSYEERKQKIDEAADEYIKENMGSTLSTDILRQLDRQKRVLLDIFNRLIEEFTNSSFEVSDVELEIKYDGEVEPYSVKDGDIAVTLHGTVDRVDVFKDGDICYFRVIDYKTGLKKFKLSDVFDGLNMQMLVYLVAIWAGRKGKYSGYLPAGLLYVPARTGGVNVGREATAEDIKLQKLKNGTMSGIILKNESVLRGMERGGEGIFIPQKATEKGLVGDMYTMDDMERIKKKLEKVILSEAKNISEGVIPISPVNSGDYEATCDYCSFADVCRRESDGQCRSPLNMAFDKVIKELKEDEESEGGENG